MRHPGRLRGCLAAFLMLALTPAAPNAAAMDFFARTPAVTLPAAVADLPIVAVEPAPDTFDDRFVIWISGDGGWSSLERDTTDLTARQGVPTAAVNTLRYFWRHRSAEDAADAIDRLARAFANRWSRSRFVLVGYSFGADIGPMAVAKLSPDVRARLDAAIFLSPSRHAFYRVGPFSWLGLGGRGHVDEAIVNLGDLRVLCVRGDRDGKTGCPREGADHVQTVALPAGHTLHGTAAQLAAVILGASRQAAPPMLEAQWPALGPALGPVVDGAQPVLTAAPEDRSRTP